MAFSLKFASGDMTLEIGNTVGIKMLKSGQTPVSGLTYTMFHGTD